MTDKFQIFTSQTTAKLIKEKYMYKFLKIHYHIGLQR